MGGIAGWWCRLESAPPSVALLHIHGGWFNLGTAKAYRNLVGHFVLRAGVDAFIPDYRLAPEHPFPAAPDDVRSCYAGLVERGYSKIAVTGDSAGGNLALGLLVYLAAKDPDGAVKPVGGVALSPVTDLGLSGASWQTRAAADPFFTQPQVAELVRSYLNGHDPGDPVASPLRADFAGLPPISIHVGDDEVLLDDSSRFVERASASGEPVTLEIWEGMVHGFVGSVGRLNASGDALQRIGAFLKECFAGSSMGRY